jgi:uncharacterized membrane protein
MASPAPAQDPADLGMAPNLAGLLCYFPICCIGPIFAIVAAIVEKRNRFIRFHAFQGLLLAAAGLVIFGGLWVLSMVVAFASGILSLLVSLLSAVIGLGFLGLAIFMMVKAYGNEELELPVIGEMAKKWAEPQAPPDAPSAG